MTYGITAVFYKNYQAMKVKDANGKRKYKYIINTGSSRSSKTFSLIEILHQICENNDNFRVTAWRDTKKDARDTIWKDFQKVLSISNRLIYANRNKTESFYAYPERNTYFEIHGADDEEKVHGLTQNVAWLNEPYKISEDTFDQIDQRSDLIFIDWNPKRSHWIEELSKRDNAIVIHSTYKDNPFCPEEQRIKIESYQPIAMCEVVMNKLISDAEAMQYNCELNELEFNELDLSELQRCQKNELQNTANKYKWQVYGLGLKAEKPNRIYTGYGVITNDEFDRISANSYFGLDFGSTNPTALVEVKYFENTFFTKERLYMPISEMQVSLAEMLTIIGVDKKALIVADSADPNRILELNNAGFYVLPAIKGQGSVNQGIDFVNSQINYYTKESENYQYEYENYEWEVVNGVNLDRPIKKDDHLMDADRYIKNFLQFHLGIK